MNQPIENIEHKTESRPFSMHRTVLNQTVEQALYIHCHGEAELFYLEYGELDFLIENRHFHMTGGDVIFIPPNLVHSATQSPEGNGCGYHALVFDLASFENNLPPYCRKYFVPVQNHRLESAFCMKNTDPDFSDVRSLLREVFRHLDGDLSQYEMRLYGTLAICWQIMYAKCFSCLETPGNDNALRGEIQKGIDYLHAHFTEQITLAELAAAAGLSESYFCRSFHEYTGQAPFAFLNRIRIIKSCEYLTSTNMKITEIAGLCGFNNISYYNRMFLAVTGSTPSDYRRVGQTKTPPS